MTHSVKILFVFIALLALNFKVSAAHIRCENKAYAGKTLAFYRLDDPVTGKKTEAFSLQIDANGKGNTDFDVTKTEYFFSDFGIYRGMLFLQANESVTLKLPPFREKSFADEKNPYFQAISFWFISESGNHLSDKVSEFEQRLNYLTDKHFNDLYVHQSKSVLDSIKSELNDLVPKTAPEVLLNHKKLKIQLVEADVFRLRPEAYSSLFNEINSESWLHPAFEETLNKTFDNQLSFMAQAIKGDEIKAAVATNNLSALTKNVESKFKIKSPVTDIVLLKLLHDGFYSDEFPKPAIEKLVKNSRFTSSKNQVIKTTAQNLLEKFSFLAKGSTAPAICLNDLEGKKICTNSGTDKFKYIVFADVETVVSKEHLKYLSRINELFSKHLEIFVVLRNTDINAAEEFFESNEVPAQILLDKNGTSIEKYKIRSFPQCFLFDEQHRVVFDFAKAPLDGFEEQFGTWLRNELFMRQRNQSR